uniref:Uncharacterized protein n=1 Tax=Romanomermis culicivorax TaxID=13658 RepID=A0A915K749_ROMCU
MFVKFAFTKRDVGRFLDGVVHVIHYNKIDDSICNARIKDLVRGFLFAQCKNFDDCAKASCATCCAVQKSDKFLEHRIDPDASTN